MAQVGERREVVEAGIGNLCPANVQRFERGNAGQAFQSGIRDFSAAQVEAPQMLPAFEYGGAFVGDLLGEI